MKLRVLALALLALPALAQTPAPVTDLAPLLAEAKADKAISAALADPKRGFESRYRDEGRFTPLILRATQAKPGQKVLDVGAGGGYLSVLLASMVGPTGHVDLHNASHWLPQFPSMVPDVLKPRLNRPNIGFFVSGWHDVPGEAGTYDVIIMGQVYHDAILEGGDIERMNQRFFELLKPSGRLVIEDHDALTSVPVGQQAYLHRVSHEDAIAQITQAGFRLDELLLHDSKYDDRRFNVFKPGVRGRTDRFIATFVKPTGDPV